MKGIMMERQCEKCVHFNIKVHKSKTQPAIGFCRRFPPTSTPLLSDIKTEDDIANSLCCPFPMVKAIDWCGEFKPKN